ncbi:flagellar hook-basal body complex protein FliE [Arcobacter sp. CECT 9188]|nr:flagellar hook-basal body complex protein FliE [Arcobacter sp. CECT 9188]
MMNVIGSINYLNPLQGIDSTDVVNQTEDLNESKYANKSFKDLLDNAINDVNDTQIQGYNAMTDIATGKVTNLQEAVQRIEEAELSLKLGLEVKNKAINAYREIMRMQI